MTESRPRLAITLGDVAGIGPEIVVRALTQSDALTWCRPVIVGHPELVRRTAHSLGLNVDLQDRETASDVGIACWNPGGDDVLDVVPGRIQAAAGRAAYESLVAATRATLRGAFDAIVTAPLHKEALHAAGLPFPGHTEILAAECGVREVAMMLYLPPGDVVRGPQGLGVAHATLHTSIRSVPGLLTESRVAETVRLLDRFLRDLGGEPRIGVCALNPHAGEHGLFGDEETTIIAPAVECCRTEGIHATGPIPADALLRRAVAGEFDGVAAMYHDQGHIALKLIGFDRAVNVTLGLPIVRTSPSHGTAFDIVGRGKANPEGLLAAMRVACRLAAQRQAEDFGGEAYDPTRA
jgi:4-hydroxythreonine-4-phosphate dehydrogenase